MTATKTCLVYSRDVVSGPLRELDRIIGLIHNLEFDPDSTRSGYFNVPVGGPDRAHNHFEDNGSDHSASDTEDSEDEELNEDEHQATESAVDEIVGEWNEHSTLEGLMLEQEPTLFQNQNTRYFHVCADEAEMHFRCGREITASYTKVSVRPKFFSPQCRTCFKQE